MTRKDYVLIAERIKCSRQAALGTVIRDQDTWEAAIADVAEMIARGLASDNPRFDRERFLKACGVQS